MLWLSHELITAKEPSHRLAASGNSGGADDSDAAHRTQHDRQILLLLTAVGADDRWCVQRRVAEGRRDQR